MARRRVKAKKRKRLGRAVKRRRPVKPRRRVNIKKRRQLPPAVLRRMRADTARRERSQELFEAARTKIAQRMGMSRGHAKVHYQTLIEHSGLSPAEAAEQTWGFQH